MNKQQLKKLRKKSFIAGCPIIIKFKIQKGKTLSEKFKEIKATKYEKVVRWKDILKINKEVKNE